MTIRLDGIRAPRLARKKALRIGEGKVKVFGNLSRAAAGGRELRRRDATELLDWNARGCVGLETEVQEIVVVVLMRCH